MNTRRQFLISAPLSVLVAAAGCRRNDEATQANSQSAPTTAGAPPTFGTGPGAGPPVTPATFAEAEKLMQVTMTPAERQQAADTWPTSLAQYLERRNGFARDDLEPDASRNQRIAIERQVRAVEIRRRFVTSKGRRHCLRAG